MSFYNTAHLTLLLVTTFVSSLLGLCRIFQEEMHDKYAPKIFLTPSAVLEMLSSPTNEPFWEVGPVFLHCQYFKTNKQTKRLALI